MTDEEAERPFFPICSEPKAWPGWSNRLKLMRKGDLTRIEELQPFNAAERSLWGWWPAIAAFPGYLDLLETLDNLDKHRKLRPVWHSINTLAAPAPPIKIKSSTVSFNTLEEGAEIGRWSCADDPIPDLPANMDVKSYFPLHVSVGDVAPFSGANELLAVLYAAVAAVLDMFRPCIETGDPALPVHSARTLWNAGMARQGYAISPIQYAIG